jgi:hypothetical protein
MSSQPLQGMSIVKFFWLRLYLLGLIPTMLFDEAGDIIEPSVSVPKQAAAKPSLTKFKQMSLL